LFVGLELFAYLVLDVDEMLGIGDGFDISICDRVLNLVSGRPLAGAVDVD
jgi:hypothetical protein